MSSTTNTAKTNKPSTRMHEVYDPKFRLVVSCGSRTHCLRYADNSPRLDLVVRVAGR